jgi:hypothetical protein
MRRPRKPFDCHEFEPNPRTRYVLMTEKSAIFWRKTGETYEERSAHAQRQPLGLVRGTKWRQDWGPNDVYPGNVG